VALIVLLSTASLLWAGLSEDLAPVISQLTSPPDQIPPSCRRSRRANSSTFRAALVTGPARQLRLTCEEVRVLLGSHFVERKGDAEAAVEKLQRCSHGNTHCRSCPSRS